jgi:hypothetical protein
VTTLLVARIDEEQGGPGKDKDDNDFARERS